MDDLVAFLNARLDEDEHWAHMAEAGWPPRDVTVVSDNPQRYPLMPTEITPSKATFILRHDPSRVLREVAAKRRILGWADSPALPDYEKHYVLDALAAVYSDHPDCRQEWKP